MIGCTHTFLRANAGGVCPLCPNAALALDDALSALQAIDQEIRRRQVEKMRWSLLDFFVEAWSVLEPGTSLELNWHHRVICDHLQHVFFDWVRLTSKGVCDDRYHNAVDAHYQNLLINICPGTNNSRIVSVIFNAWAWLHRPDFTVIALSANPSVAVRDAAFVKVLIASSWYVQTFEVDWSTHKLKNSDGDFKIVRYSDGIEQPLGGRYSAGYTAAITGQRAHCLLIDDPMDAADIHSTAVLQNTNLRWDDAIYNRVNDNDCSMRIGVMQRLHHKDWSAHVVSNSKWLHLVIPLHSRDLSANGIGYKDPRELGVVLHSERFSDGFITAEIKRLEAIGVGQFDAQYEQRTKDTTGAILKLPWFRYFQFTEQEQYVPRIEGASTFPTKILHAIRPSLGQYFDEIYLSIDSNFKLTTSGSECAILVIGTIGTDYFVIDDLTCAMDFEQTEREVLRLIALYKPNGVLIENKANGDAISAKIKGVHGNVIMLNPEGGKESRGNASAPTVAAGRVYLNLSGSWLPKFISGPDSVTIFPFGNRDDRFDALTQAVIHLEKRFVTSGFLPGLIAATKRKLSDRAV